MIHLMLCREPCKIYIHLAFTYSVGPSSVVWSELRPAAPFPPIRVIEVKWSRALSLVCEVALSSLALLQHYWRPAAMSGYSTKMTDDEEADTQIIFFHKHSNMLSNHTWRIRCLGNLWLMTVKSPHIEEDSYKQVLTSTTSIIKYDYVCMCTYIYTHIFTHTHTCFM
jgi:hypothetical protein